jgi:2-polyprenyl-3-methyl-5-hydroxy-6-metoxy-1,4-benzoquinol methylase
MYQKGKAENEEYKCSYFLMLKIITMENFDRKKHWENIYQTKQLEEVSWFQPNPLTSLRFLKQFNIPKTAKIIDVGGGDSFLVDHLIDLGYQNISVLDISSAAIERAKTAIILHRRDIDEGSEAATRGGIKDDKHEH